MIPVQFIELVALQVANIDESVKWYAEMLGRNLSTILR